MAPLMLLACPAFILVSSFLSGSSAAAPTGEGNTDLCLTGINLGRAAKLDTRVPVVKADKDLEEEAIKIIEYVVPDASKCTLSSDSATPASLYGLLLQAADNNAPKDEKIITGLIQAQIRDGLKALGPSYDATSKFDADTTFKEPSARNLAHIMFTDSTKVGCAVTSNCEAGNAYIFCMFNATPSDASVPFSEALYKALEARENAGIDLTNLTAADLNTPLTPESGGSSSAIPGAAIIFLSLVGLLATQ